MYDCVNLHMIGQTQHEARGHVDDTKYHRKLLLQTTGETDLINGHRPHL